MEQTTAPTRPTSVDELQEALRGEMYVADRGLAMSAYLALHLGRPLFLECEAGVGKTEMASALASALNSRLIRLQCYESLDVSQAVYEWNYSRHLRLPQASGEVDRQNAEREIFSEEFLIKRPLLQALEGGDRKGLLRSDAHRHDADAVSLPRVVVQVDLLVGVGGEVEGLSIVVAVAGQRVIALLFAEGECEVRFFPPCGASWH